MKLKKNDFIVGAGLVLLLSTYFVTRLLLYNVMDLCGTTEKISGSLETNPLLKVSFLLGNLGEILNYLLLPAAVLGLYLLAREGRLEIDEPTLDYLALVFLLIAVLNFCSDAGALLGVLLR